MLGSRSATSSWSVGFKEGTEKPRYASMASRRFRMLEASRPGELGFDPWFSILRRGLGTSCRIAAYQTQSVPIVAGPLGTILTFARGLKMHSVLLMRHLRQLLGSSSRSISHFIYQGQKFLPTLDHSYSSLSVVDNLLLSASAKQPLIVHVPFSPQAFVGLGPKVLPSLALFMVWAASL